MKQHSVLYRLNVMIVVSYAAVTEFGVCSRYGGHIFKFVGSDGITVRLLF